MQLLITIPRHHVPDSSNRDSLKHKPRPPAEPLVCTCTWRDPQCVLIARLKKSRLPSSCLPRKPPCCAAGLTATQLALLGVTADAPQGGEPPEVAQKMVQDRYWQHVALRDSLPHVSGAWHVFDAVS